MELEGVKASLSIGKWKCTVDAKTQHQRKVVIIKRDWWKVWEKPIHTTFTNISYKVMTQHLVKKKQPITVAITTWGVFLSR